MRPNEIIAEFDEFLRANKTTFMGVAIGGAPLNLLGIIIRETRDCDIIDPVIPKKVQKLALALAKKDQARGGNLRDDWLNNGPISIKDKLPEGWKTRLQLAFKGKALTLYTLERQDLLKTKLTALCDRGIDKPDCIAMNPTKEELKNALAWVKEQDGNPTWPEHVDDILTKLAKDLGYEL